MLGSQLLVQRGSMRSRARASERATARSTSQRNKQVAASTFAALDCFEEKLENDNNAQFQAYDGLDEAGASMRPHSSKLARTKSLLDMNRRQPMIGYGQQNGMDAATPPERSQSTKALASRRDDPLVMKPPSPLKFYDYGCVSMKPRSMHAQHLRQLDKGARPEHRRTAQGFLFPGGHFERGTYGFSIVDPILLPSRPWVGAATVSDRWRGDAADLRPLAADGLSTSRNRKEGAVVSPSVRATAGHAARAAAAFQHMDKCREEAVIEQARFENGVFEGRWRDPMLDLPPGVVPEASPAVDHRWLSLPMPQMNSDQVMALRLLYNINSAMRQIQGRFRDLFAKENQCARGVLELDEFSRGLLRLGVYREGEVSVDRLRHVVSIIDPGFDGRVNLPAIQRAIVEVRSLKEDPPPVGASLADMKRWGQRRGAPVIAKLGDYGDVAPINAVKLNQDHGIFEWQGNMQKFRTQQRDLLTHHGEA